MEHTQYFADIRSQLAIFLDILDRKLISKEFYAEELYDSLSRSSHIMAANRLRTFLNNWSSYSANEKLVVFYNAMNYLRVVFLSVCMVIRKLHSEHHERQDDNTKHYLECASQEQGELYEAFDSIHNALMDLEAKMPYKLKYQLIFMHPSLSMTQPGSEIRLQELQSKLRTPKCKF